MHHSKSAYFFLTIAALLLVTLGFWVFTQAVGSRRSLSGNETVITLAHVVQETSDCRWFVEHPNHRGKTDLTSGDTIRVTAGSLKLTYVHGIDVTLHAPAAYQLISSSEARMMLGRLSARVAPGAEGFSVETPRAKVVDLGTEFGLDVNTEGSTDVVVFEGEVDVERAMRGESLVQRLRMGEAIRLDSSGTASRIVSIDHRRFSEMLEVGKPLRPPIITEVRDNIHRDEGSWNFYEIVHAGMQEDARAFVDRTRHEWNGIDKRGMPSYLIGGDYVKTFNNDKVNHDIRIDVTVAMPARLYVLLDDRLEPPEWLRQGFEYTGDKIGIDTGPFFSKGAWHNDTPPGVGPGISVEDTLSVWVREVKEPGVVHLGATEAPESGPNMYGIVAVPLDKP